MIIICTVIIGGRKICKYCCSIPSRLSLYTAEEGGGREPQIGGRSRSRNLKISWSRSRNIKICWSRSHTFQMPTPHPCLQRLKCLQLGGITTSSSTHDLSLFTVLYIGQTTSLYVIRKPKFDLHVRIRKNSVLGSVLVATYIIHIIMHNTHTNLV